MPSRHRAVRLTVLFPLAALLACAESSTEPDPRATTDAFESMSNRELLVALMTKLDALEARMNGAAGTLRQQIDSVLSSRTGVMPTLATEAPPAINLLEVEGSVCVELEAGARGAVESSLTLLGGGTGSLGVDAYGNGGKGVVTAMAAQDVKVIPDGRFKARGMVCFKMSRQRTADGTQIAALIQGMMAAATAPNMVAAANGLQIGGQKIGSALSVMANVPDLQFGVAAPVAVLNAIPAPTGLQALLQNPAGVLQRAVEAGNFGVTQMCNQSLFTGQFAQRAMDGCNLRTQMPTGAGLLGILNGLNGLSTTLNGIQGDLSSACSTINAMRPARIDIPSHSVDLPGTLPVVEVFPGYGKNLFPGIGPAC